MTSTISFSTWHHESLNPSVGRRAAAIMLFSLLVTRLGTWQIRFFVFFCFSLSSYLFHELKLILFQGSLHFHPYTSTLYPSHLSVSVTDSSMHHMEQTWISLSHTRVRKGIQCEVFAKSNMWIQNRVVYTRSVRVQVNSDGLQCHRPTGCWWKVLLLAEYNIDIGKGWGVIGGSEKKRKGRSV